MGYTKTTTLQVKTALITQKGYVKTNFRHNTVNDILSNVTRKSVNLTANLLDKACQKGVTLSDEEMEIREQFIPRNQLLPKWDIFIKPTYEMEMLFIE